MPWILVEPSSKPTAVSAAEAGSDAAVHTMALTVSGVAAAKPRKKRYLCATTAMR
jgi:hypothetical protein